MMLCGPSTSLIPCTAAVTAACPSTTSQPPPFQSLLLFAPSLPPSIDRSIFHRPRPACTARQRGDRGRGDFGLTKAGAERRRGEDGSASHRALPAIVPCIHPHPRLSLSFPLPSPDLIHDPCSSCPGEGKVWTAEQWRGKCRTEKVGDKDALRERSASLSRFRVQGSWFAFRVSGLRVAG